MKINNEANSKYRQEKTFGMVFALLFMLIGFGAIYKNLIFPTAWLFLSFIFFMLAIKAPQSLTKLNMMWIKIGVLLHKITSPIILAGIFFLVITPIGLIMRITRRRPLNLIFNDGLKSYWIKRETTNVNKDNIHNQF